MINLLTSFSVETKAKFLTFTVPSHVQLDPSGPLGGETEGTSGPRLSITGGDRCATVIPPVWQSVGPDALLSRHRLADGQRVLRGRRRTADLHTLIFIENITILEILISRSDSLSYLPYCSSGVTRGLCSPPSPVINLRKNSTWLFPI